MTSQPPDQPKPAEAEVLAEDEHTLNRLGYKQELARRMSGFSNCAISLSIICILVGCVTSFQFGFCTVGGAAMGLGWPLVCCFALVVAMTMAQVASAFPTAGGLYHWASILGGKGWGWVTAWFNMVGLLTGLAAVNAGSYDFIFGAFHWPVGGHPEAVRNVCLVLLIASQAWFNHRGIRLTSRLTDLSGYLILFIATVLTVAMLAYARHYDFSRLITFTNYSGLPPGKDAVLPHSGSLLWLFALSFLLPGYTLTGFDASAHTAEETVDAAANVPRGIVRSVAVSGLFGWIMLCAVVLAIPNMQDAAMQGSNIFPWIMEKVLPRPLALFLYAGIGVTQYVCGLASMTSASRMMYAFARDGGLPGSRWLSHVSPRTRAPGASIWTAAVLALFFTFCVPYSAIAASCAVFLFISYVLPAAAGFFAHGRTWTKMGPWHLGRWYRPLALLSVVCCVGLIVIGVQPPNQIALTILIWAVGLMLTVWFALERKRFRGPPQINVNRNPQK